MNIVLATNNPSKAEHIKSQFAKLPIELRTLQECGITEEPVENGKTLEENALIKAKFAWERTGKCSIADDTGIFIDALGGAPGIHSGRFAGVGKTIEEGQAFVIEKMKDVKEQDRSAVFRTVAVVFEADGTHSVFRGEAYGRLLTEPATKPQPKMPYSAIFVPDGSFKTWAEMTDEERNKISHRGKAFKQVADFLKKEVIK